MVKKNTYRGIIYKYTFPNGKVYIGQTINPRKRKADHLREGSGSRNIAFWRAYKKYGTVEYEEIEQVEDVSQEALCERLNDLEQKYIAEYKSDNGRYGYNLTSGGKVCVVNEEGRQHMSDARTDKIPVLQYDLDGNFVKEYISIIDAAKAIGAHAGSVWSCCLGIASGKRAKKAQIVKGFTFRFKSDYPDIHSHIDLSITTNKKSVLQFTLSGIFVKEWNSIIEVQETLGYKESGVRQCCYGKYRQSNGFMWRFRDDFDKIPQRINPVRAKISLPFPKLTTEQIEKRNRIYREKYAKPVVQYDFEGIFVAEYPTIEDASKSVNGNSSTICSACKLGKSKSAFGYQWRYKEDVENLQKIEPYKIIYGQRNEILQCTKDGIVIKEWKSVREAASILGYNRNTIYMALNGRKQTVGGFVWRYKNKK